METSQGEHKILIFPLKRGNDERKDIVNVFTIMDYPILIFSNLFLDSTLDLRYRMT